LPRFPKIRFGACLYLPLFVLDARKTKKIKYEKYEKYRKV
jgi:hypothetical protein